MNKRQRIVCGLYLSIGEVINVLRDRSGMSRQEMAKKAGLTSGKIFELERGEYDKISVADIAAIGEALGVYIEIGVRTHPADYIDYNTEEEE